jgi:ribosomal protein S18 acetylase RimI-like enzyme
MVRRASKADVILLSQWVQKLLNHVRESSSDIYVQDLDEDSEEKTKRKLEERVDSDEGVILVAENKRTPVGFIMGEIATPFIAESKIKKIGYISACWVEPKERRKGVGRDLLQAIENWFRKKEIRYVDLHYLIGNTEAEKAWTRMGFKPYRVASRKEI